MTLKEAKRLKVGSVVRWTDESPQNGEVIEVGYAGFKVRWADGVVSVCSFSWGEQCDFLRGCEIAKAEGGA
ncbi:MAG TPA: hypothetical protein VM529_25330 [Gemmata sp.]|nr:hypothetical protein [Gemmata sp.]